MEPSPPLSTIESAIHSALSAAYPNGNYCLVTSDTDAEGNTKGMSVVVDARGPHQLSAIIATILTSALNSNLADAPPAIIGALRYTLRKFPTFQFHLDSFLNDGLPSSPPQPSN